MHNNFYFLRQLSKRLEEILSGAVLFECYSQHKNELILRFETKAQSFFIKANLQPDFSCLSFPESFNRARRNSVDLFNSLIGCQVLSTRQYENERSFALILSDHQTLLFNLHGNQSNIISFKDDAPHELFRKNLKRDLDIKLTSLDRSIDWSYECFAEHRENLNRLYFTLGKVCWAYLGLQGFDDATPHQQWQHIQEMVHKLNEPEYYIVHWKDKVVFSLLPIGEIQQKFNDPVTAITTFYFTYLQHHALQTEKSSALSIIRARIKNIHQYLDSIQEKLTNLERDHPYKTWADLIMANLHNIPNGASGVSVENFYDNNRITEVPLKSTMSPQKVAELYYKKARNQVIEKKYLQQAIANKTTERASLEEAASEIENSTELKQVRTWASHFQLQKTRETEKVNVPYREIEYKGFMILIGKNAASNDELTLKYSYKEDLWLHAKDVSGSHVLIKYQAGKAFPKDVIEKAAQVAAYNSKRKNESLCPVIVTPKKFVRKRKGDPPGAVVVEKEEVILVEPCQA